VLAPGELGTLQTWLCCWDPGGCWKLGHPARLPGAGDWVLDRQRGGDGCFAFLCMLCLASQTGITEGKLLSLEEVLEQGSWGREEVPGLLLGSAGQAQGVACVVPSPFLPG